MVLNLKHCFQTSGLTVGEGRFRAPAVLSDLLNCGNKNLLTPPRDLAFKSLLEAKSRISPLVPIISITPENRPECASF